jgi:sensor histidine kinase YesM
MQNPFLVKRTYTIFYSLAWILIIGVHVSVLYFFSNQSLVNSIADGLVFNLLFIALGLGIWFAVRYYDSARGNILDVFIYHLGTAALALGLYIGLGYLTMKYVFPGLEGYQEFLEGSMPWRAISGIFLYSLIVLIYYLYINQEDRKERIKKEAELQLMVREAEIDRLKSQINPHFLFNSLNSIASLTLTSPDKARDMIVKLSSFLRSSLEYRQNELTDLETELENIGQYLEIEKVRFGDKLSFTFDVNESCRTCQLPNMILQPLFENAIKHGVYESTEPVEINCTAEETRDGLLISIINDFDPDMPARKGKGIGLQNVNNRLQLVYQATNLMQVSKSGSRFIARLLIPQK